MIVLGNLLVTTGTLLKSIAGLYMMIVIASAVITWFPVDPWHPAVKLLRGLTDPVYEWIRKVMPKALWNTGVDFTPFLVILALWFLNGAVFQSLIDVGMRMR